MSDPTTDPAPTDPGVPPVDPTPAPDPTPTPDPAPVDPGTGNPEAVASAVASHDAVIDEHTTAIAEEQKSIEPWVQVTTIGGGASVPGAPTGEDAEFQVSTHDGASFFHTLASLPAHLKDSLGNAILGQHVRTTIDGPA